MIFVFTAKAQRWYVDVDKELGANTAFSIEFILENAKGSKFRNPNFKGFKILNGPMKSSTTQIINGRASTQQSFTYNLMALDEGEYTIGTASIIINKIQHNTDPVKIKVIKGEDIGSIVDESGNNMVLRLVLSDSIAYPGQQVMLRYILMDKGNTRFNGVVKQDEFKGMFAKQIPSTARPKRIVQNGETYQSKIVGNIAIFPQKSGLFNIDPASVQIGIPIKSNRKRGFFNFQQYNNVMLTSNGAQLKVIDLPEGAPKNYNGAVGAFSLEGTINKNKTTTDDAIILQLKVKGNGDIRMIEAPDLGYDDNWEVYEPTVVDENEYLENNQVNNYKTFEYLMLPNKPGKLKIQPGFSYYDVDSMTYRTVTTKPVYIDVTQGNRKILADDSKVLTDRSIQGLIPRGGTSFKASNPFSSIPFVGFLLCGFLVSFIMIRKKKMIDEYGSLSEEERKKLEAKRVAEGKLSLANDYMEGGLSKKFFEEISSAMNGYLADKYNISHSEISKDLIKNKLVKEFPGSNISNEYIDILQQCELALFANQSGSEKMNSVYKLSLDLIGRIER